MGFGLSQIAGIAQGALGIGQMIGGFTMPKPEVPDYEIPSEVYQNMSDAEYWSYKGLPEAQKQQFIDNMMQTGQSALSASTERKGGLGMISSIAEQQRQQNRDLLVTDTQARMSNIDRLFNARREVAAAENTKQEWNRENVMYERQRRDQMLGAGMQNLGQSFGTFAGTGSNIFGNKKTGSKSFIPKTANTKLNSDIPTNFGGYNPKGKAGFGNYMADYASR